MIFFFSMSENYCEMNIDNLDKEILDIISNNLDYVDLFFLSYTCKKLQSKISGITDKKISLCNFYVLDIARILVELNVIFTEYSIIDFFEKETIITIDDIEYEFYIGNNIMYCRILDYIEDEHNRDFIASGLDSQEPEFFVEVLTRNGNFRRWKHNYETWKECFLKNTSFVI